MPSGLASGYTFVPSFCLGYGRPWYEHRECWKGCVLPSACLSLVPARLPVPVYLAINSVFVLLYPIPTLTLLQIHVLNSNPQCDGIRRYIIKMEPLWMVLAPFERRPQRAPSPLPPLGEDLARKSSYEPGSRPSWETRSAGAFILDFPVSRAVGKKCVSISHPVFCILFTAAWKK